MISLDFKNYDYYRYGAENSRGQRVLETEPTGAIKMAIYTITQSIQDNIKYKSATYMGLTHFLLDDTCVVQYGDLKLKVLYVNPKGRLKQVFFAEI